MVRPMKRIVPLLGLAALLLMPSAAAQAFDGFSIDSPDAAALTFPVGQATSIPVEVTVGCALILQEAPDDVSVTVSTDLPPAWGATEDTLTFSLGPDCADASGSITETGSITVNPTSNATAVAERAFAITATGADKTATFDFPASWIEYTPGHTFSTNVTFPYNFTAADNGMLEFMLTLEIAGNADTMVMFENVKANGTVTGLAYQYYYPSKDDFQRTKLMPITWSPPNRAWTSDNITFMSYSHCLGEPPCDPDADKTPDVEYRWQITNGLSPAGGSDSGKKSPGPGALLLVGLAAAALVAARRR